MTKQYPLTPIQQGMFLHGGITQDKGVDIYQVILDFHEELNVEEFITAWRNVVQRHDVFKSSFHWGESKSTFQLFEGEADIECTEINVNTSNTQKQSSAIREYLNADRNRGFDTAQPPLVRLAILKFTEDYYCCILTFHHIIIDGYSTGVLLEEFSSFYDGKVLPSSLLNPVPFRQYLDFLSRKSHEESRDWWSKLLSGVESATSLITSSDEGRNESPAMVSQWINFNAQECQLLQKFSGNNDYRASLASLFLAGWSQVLHRYSQQDDVVFGYTRACRSAQSDDIQGIVGILINTVLFKSTCQRSTIVSDYLTQVQEQLTSVRPHELTPLSKIREWSDIKNGSPLFESLIVIQPYEKDNFFKLKKPGSPWLKRNVRQEAMPDNPLTLNCYSGNTIDIEAVYNTAKFSESMVKQILQSFKLVLLGLSETVNVPILSLNIMLPEEKDRILKHWNNTSAIVPDFDGVHIFFEKQAKLNPQLPAVTDGKRSLSYSEMDQRSNTLSSLIKKAGGVPDMPIGILMERSIQWPVAVLGVLKSGSAYVPLDPAFPEERLAYMIEKAGIKIILSTSLMREHPCIGCTEVIWVDALEGKLPEVVNIPLVKKGKHLAYIKFTSGSTGKPKAVAMPHAPLVNLISWQIKHSHCRKNTNTLQFAAQSFDVSFQEMFSTWAVGGTLVMVAEETKRDLVELIRFIEEQNIHRLFLPFVMLQELANAAIVLSIFPTSLREVITAGEQLQITSAITNFFDSLQDCRLINQYGPTESHVVAFYELDKNRKNWEFLPPIGRPIDNTRLYILDSLMKPVPVGVPGELYIAGACLANGYFNEPKLTAERFIDVLPELEPEGRLYRTGDLCRYQQSGLIDYLGRVDQQVKIRGFRVELSEIETVIRQHPSVKDVVVDARGTGRQSKKLIAYIIANPEVSDQKDNDMVESLREWLLAHLPDYMVPSAFLFVHSFAKTPSGKLDRRALPEPGVIASNQKFVKPSTETERLLVAMWSEILDLENISIKDSFFDLGGDSLAAAVLFIEIKTRFGKELPVSTLYQKKTIEKLAIAIDTGVLKVKALVPMRSTGTRTPLILIHGGYGSILHMRHIVELMGEDQPCYGLEAPDAETRPIYETVEERATAYLEEILELQPQGPYQLGGYCMGGVTALEIAHQLTARGHHIDLLLFIDCFAPRHELGLDSAVKKEATRKLTQYASTIYKNDLTRKLLNSSVTQFLWSMIKKRTKKYKKYKAREARKSVVQTKGRYAFFDSYRNAIGSYNTAPFRGNVHIFRSQLDKTSRNLGWDDLFYGNEKIYSIPGDHTESLYPPNVEKWAFKIRDVLSKSTSINRNAS